MSKSLMTLAAILGMAAFLFLIKLMYDMTLEMNRMTDQVTQMAGHMQTLVTDVHEMRGSVDRMAMVLQQGGQQMQQMNPAGMMQGIMPGIMPGSGQR